MGELEFLVYKISSDFGDWLAAFEGEELIFLGHYGIGKKKLHQELGDFFHTHYHFQVGSFSPAKWSKGTFWNHKHKIKLHGTDFQMKVWLQLLKIPRGQTCTYSELAIKIRKPSAVRAVASAVAKNPVAFYIPCHRVRHKNSSLLAYHWGGELKKLLLTAEGYKFS
jgi:AraC family transcriptional regulator of adaptative response/methylated-DNA-[protein]-cysteine methyltransferase